MASGLTPPAQQYGSSGSSPQDKSPLSTLNLGFLKSIGDRKTTRDGQPPKRRGPKPDAKPALTRRQELNRQAQRTHRERKELYIKALEDEVLRLKEIYSHMSHDKEKLAEENRHLRSLLGQSGRTLGSNSGSLSPQGDRLGAQGGGYTSSGSVSDSYGGPSSRGGGPASSHSTAITPLSSGALSNSGGHGQRDLSPGSQSRSRQGLTPPYQPQPPVPPLPDSIQPQRSLARGPNPVIDYEQAGIDFVLSQSASPPDTSK